jgi:hypothetical protein
LSTVPTRAANAGRRFLSSATCTFVGRDDEHVGGIQRALLTVALGEARGTREKLIQEGRDALNLSGCVVRTALMVDRNEAQAAAAERPAPSDVLAHEARIASVDALVE